MVVEEQKKGFIYLLTNLVNGKKYVGQTRAKTVERRWTAHIMMATAAKPAVLIHRAIKKYGVNKFSAEVLWTGPVDKLNIKETHFIKVHDSFVDDGHSGYNLTRGGGTRSQNRLYESMSKLQSDGGLILNNGGSSLNRRSYSG